MRVFNEREKYIIAEVIKSNTVVLNEFLQKIYFSKYSKRAFIIQTEARYAVFFLSPEVYDNEGQNDEALKLFFELITLLDYLNKNGYITIYREQTEKLYFFQETFGGAKITNNSIVLNDAGDYTFSPRRILDVNGKIIFKGTIFKSDIFELILRSTTGVMIVSEKLDKLLLREKEGEYQNAENQKMKTMINRIYWLGLFVGILSLVILSLFGFQYFI